jgi:hypothetical protein
MFFAERTVRVGWSGDGIARGGGGRGRYNSCRGCTCRIALRKETNFACDITALPPTVAVLVVFLDDLDGLTSFKGYLVLVFGHKVVQGVDILGHGREPGQMRDGCGISRDLLR